MKKVNAINPEIVVHGTLEKPYYEVQYYDVDGEAWYIGYSSYKLSIVCGYIRDYFNIVLQDADFQPVKHGKWIIDYAEGRKNYHAHCSECNKEPDRNIGGDYYIDNLSDFCPNCGARMSGDSDKDNNVRNLTDEGTAIYESRVESEAKDTGLNIMGGDGDEQ